MTDKLGNTVMEEAASVGGKLSETAMQVKDKLTDFGRTATSKIDENRDAAASGLQKAASALHDRAENLPGVDTVSNLAHDAANKLTATADYVREHDANRMMADVETLVKNNPGPSLLAAVVVGFLAGRAFSSNME